MANNNVERFSCMNVNVNDRSVVDELLAVPLPAMENDPDAERFRDMAISCLWGVVERADLESINSIKSSLREWQVDKIHGVEHSYLVYKLAKEIRDEDNLPVTDEQLFLQATIHDLSQFLPLVNHLDRTEVRMKEVWLENDKKAYIPVSKDIELSAEDGEKEQEWKEKRHITLMAWIVRNIGTQLGFSSAETRQIARDVYYHDHFWNKPTFEQVESYRKVLSDAGRILADADRLVYKGKADGKSAVEFGIERCHGYGFGKEHFIREELSAEDRWQWEQRSAGFFDTLSVLLRQFTSPKFYFHTEYGRNMNRKNKREFTPEIRKYVGDLYEKSKKKLETVSDESGQITLQYGIKLKKQIELYSTKGQDLTELLEQVYNKPRGEDENEYGRRAYGYNVYIDGEWIDPSIVLFNSKADCINAVDEAIKDYEEFLKEKFG